MDRLARQPRDLEDLIDWVEYKKVPAKPVTGDIDLMTSGGPMLARMLVSVALKSSEDTSRRQARAAVQHAQQGRVVRGGPRRFGWKIDGQTLVPAEAVLLREVAARVEAGESPRLRSTSNGARSRRSAGRCGPARHSTTSCGTRGSAVSVPTPASSTKASRRSMSGGSAPSATTASGCASTGHRSSPRTSGSCSRTPWTPTPDVARRTSRHLPPPVASTCYPACASAVSARHGWSAGWFAGCGCTAAARKTSAAAMAYRAMPTRSTAW